MKRNFICLIIIGLFFLSSCTSVKKITIQVLKPAKISIPSNIKKIDIVNRSNSYFNDSINKNPENNNSTYSDSVYSTECLYGLIDELNSAGRFDSINTDDIINISTIDSIRNFTPLNIDETDSISNKNKSDAIIELYKFNYIDQLNFNYLYAFVIANLKVKTESGWRLYFTDNENEYFEDVISDTVKWIKVGYDYDDATEKLPYREDAFYESAYKTGKKYASYITPHWIDTKRMYYNYPVSKSEKINFFISNDEWSSAAIMWKKYTENRNPKKAAKASYNLALAYEMQGDLENALLWSEKSFSLYNSPLSKKYILILKNRIDDLQIINEQMPQE